MLCICDRCQKKKDCERSFLGNYCELCETDILIAKMKMMSTLPSRSKIEGEK